MSKNKKEKGPQFVQTDEAVRFFNFFVAHIFLMVLWVFFSYVFYGLLLTELYPHKYLYVEVLTPNTSERDCIWR